MSSVDQKLSAILFIAQKGEMSILEVEALAKALDKNITFDLCGPKSKFRCRFRDASYGLFEKIDGGTVFHVNQFQFVSDIWCENLDDYA